LLVEVELKCGKLQLHITMITLVYSIMWLSIQLAASYKFCSEENVSVTACVWASVCEQHC